MAQLSPLILPILAAQAPDAQAANETEGGGAEEGAGAEAGGGAGTQPPSSTSSSTSSQCVGWQGAYYCLLLLERVAAKAPESLGWEQEGQAALWEAVLKLLLHRCVLLCASWVFCVAQF